MQRFLSDHSDAEDEDLVVCIDELTEGSFHSDSSNVDSTDDDICYYKNEKAKKRQVKEDVKANKTTAKENLNKKGKHMNNEKDKQMSSANDREK